MILTDLPEHLRSNTKKMTHGMRCVVVLNSVWLIHILCVKLFVLHFFVSFNMNS